MKLTLHKYQEKAVQFMLEKACGALFLEMGLGKTGITLSAISILKKQKLIGKTLIVAPLRVAQNVWAQEAAKWDELSHLRIGVMHGKDKLEVLNGDYDIYVTNYESLKWLQMETAKKEFPFSVLVLDELSKCKSTATQRFKTLKKMLPKFHRRYGLTGTPAANGLLDLFGQLYCIDTGATFGPYITAYKATYFQQTGFGGYDWVLKPGAEAEIHEKLKSRALQMSAADYLELPDLVKVNIPVQLPDDARVQYLSMEKKLKLEVEEGKVTAANAAVAIGKCRQLAGGSVYGTDDITQVRTAHHVHSAKVEALEDLVEELAGNSLIVFYEYQHEADAINKHFGGKLPILAGGMSEKQAATVLSAWNNGETQILLAQSAAAALGLNLQKGGNNICWFTLTYSLDTYLQANARLHRQGQEKPVFVYHLLAEKTVDYAVLSIINKKDKQQNSLLDALGEYWK
jgi:SNF2 family DNA or RNA helicase